MNKNKLQKLLTGLSEFDSNLSGNFKSAEDEIKKIINRIKKEAQNQTLDEIQTIDETKKGMKGLKQQLQEAIDSLAKIFDKLKTDLIQSEKDLTESFNNKLTELKTAVAQYRVADSDQVKTISEQIVALRANIKEIYQRNEIITELKKEIEELKKEEPKESSKDLENFKVKLDKVEEDVVELHKKTMSALASHHGGGNANRNILVSSNPSTLSRYTDLNLKPGTNVTLTYVNNDTLKTTDLTIAATGGSGISRNISTVSVSSVVAATASTDIVVIANAGIQLTMPTAVGNSNLYTLKHTSTSSILVNTTGGQTIDGASTLIMPVQYTSVDLISDSANWVIT